LNDRTLERNSKRRKMLTEESTQRQQAGPNSNGKSNHSANTVEKIVVNLSRQYQYYLDKTVVHLWPRWIAAGVLLVLFWVRVWMASSHHIVTYGLHIYLLNLLIGFLSPAIDPELSADGPMLPTTSDEEYRPFSRRLPEFKFWYSCFRGTFISLLMTFFSIFDVPVFWPILLAYFIALFVLTMRRQIAHMIKHRYIPWSWGKKKYTKKDALHV
jgi:hypothetical protein